MDVILKIQWYLLISAEDLAQTSPGLAAPNETEMQPKRISNSDRGGGPIAGPKNSVWILGLSC